MSRMAKVTEMFERVAFKITSFKYIMVIKSAFVTLMPVIIAGAFAVLMQNMVMSPETGLAVFRPFRFLSALEPIMASINYATLNFITIGAVFLIGIELGKLNGHESFFPGLMALMSYISVIPSAVLLEVNGSMQEVVNVLAKEFTDPKSLFLGMFISIVSVEIFSKLSSMDRLKIKMPDSVPANVSVSFGTLFPSIITVTIIASFGFAFHRLTGVYLHEAVYNVVQKPLEGAIQGLPGILLLVFVAQFFWVIGIHGNQMVKPIREPFFARFDYRQYECIRARRIDSEYHYDAVLGCVHEHRRIRRHNRSVDRDVYRGETGGFARHYKDFVWSRHLQYQ